MFSLIFEIGSFGRRLIPTSTDNRGIHICRGWCFFAALSARATEQNLPSK
jgi:hypothetical protein